MTRWVLGSVALVVAGCGGESQRALPAEPIGAGTGGMAGGGTGGSGGTAGTTGGTNGAGSSAGGEPGSGASGGTGGMSGMAGGVAMAGAGAGGMAATGGEAGAPDDDDEELVPCDATRGMGCDADSFCIDLADDCAVDSGAVCPGYCATRLPVRTCEGPDATPCPDGFVCVPGAPGSSGDTARSTCVESAPACGSDLECPTGFVCVMQGMAGVCSPDRVNCSGPVSCPALVAECPAGYVRSTPDDCYGPCVRVEHCTCQHGYECLAPAVCDVHGLKCAIPKAPAPRCRVPFDPATTCENPVFTRYAFIDGQCQEVMVAPCGQDNEFQTLEECQTYCEGTPIEEPCAEGFVHATACIACGPLGGCGAMREICAKQCTVQEDCSGGASCADGVCEAVGCI